MKKYSKLIAISTLILSLIGIKLASAQEFEQIGLKEYKNHFYFNPFVVFTSTFQIGYERYFNSGSIMIITGGILSDNNSWSKEGFNSEVHYRFKIYNYQESNGKVNGYPRYNAIYYMSPYVQYKMMNVKYTGNSDEWGWGGSESLTTDVKTTAVGVLFGAKFIVYQKVTLDFFAGGSIRYSKLEGDNPYDYNWVSVSQGILSPFYTGVLPKMGIQIGMNF